MSKRSTNTFGGRDWESTDDADSECWSESLPDDAQKSQPQHESTDTSLGHRWPNLRRQTISSEEEQLGVSDQGTVHMMTSEEDDSSPSLEDDSIVSYYYTDGSSYVEIQSSSDDYDPCSSEESSYVEKSVSNHMPLHSRFATLTLSSAAASPEKIKQQAVCLEEYHSEMTMKETLHSGDSKRRSRRSSNASVQVAAICNHVRSKLQELDAKMHKVIGEPMALKLSDATYRSLRASLNGRRHSTAPSKINNRSNSHHTPGSTKSCISQNIKSRHSTPNLSSCKKLEDAFVNLGSSPNKSARSYSPRSLNRRGMMHHRRESDVSKSLPFMYF